jgi:hypothetical protein
MSVNISPGELGSLGLRHAMNWLGYYAQHSGARSARIITADAMVRERMILRLPIPLSDDPSGIELIPFCELIQPEFHAPVVAGFFRNTSSYRKLLHPFEKTRSLRWLRRQCALKNYSLIEWRGIYPPAFVFWWSCALMAASRFPDLHFQWEDRAFMHLADRSPFSAWIVFYAKLNS